VSIVVVLHQPQDLVNIASVVRAMKNFELSHLRLVAPEEYDEHRIEGIAHNSYDILERIRQFDDIDAALADCTFVVGLTARERTAKRSVVRPRNGAAEIVRQEESGRVAIVLGPEDRGLSNTDLDRCHLTVTIPTNPDYPSLNLSQAFTVIAYELRLARGVRSLKAPRRQADPATAEQLEQVFLAAERALESIEFFKTRNPEYIMRTVREIAHRSALDTREAKLVAAMCFEVGNYLRRHGLE
jgi:TrmH family RNA methyltransferase